MNKKGFEFETLSFSDTLHPGFDQAIVVGNGDSRGVFRRSRAFPDSFPGGLYRDLITGEVTRRVGAEGFSVDTVESGEEMEKYFLLYSKILGPAALEFCKQYPLEGMGLMGILPEIVIDPQSGIYIHKGGKTVFEINSLGYSFNPAAIKVVTGVHNGESVVCGAGGLSGLRYFELEDSYLLSGLRESLFTARTHIDLGIQNPADLMGDLLPLLRDKEVNQDALRGIIDISFILDRVA